MKTGPRPKPTALKRAAGNPGKRPLNSLEPHPDLGVPDMPAGLSCDAKQKWQELAPQLERMGVLTCVDGDVLAMYCTIWAWWCKTATYLDEHGLVREWQWDDEGAKVSRGLQAEFKAAKELVLFLRQLGSELGLTPSARTRLRIEKGAEDELMAFIEAKPVGPTGKRGRGRPRKLKFVSSA